MHYEIVYPVWQYKINTTRGFVVFLLFVCLSILFAKILFVFLLLVPPSKYCLSSSTSCRIVFLFIRADLSVCLSVHPWWFVCLSILLCLFASKFILLDISVCLPVLTCKFVCLFFPLDVSVCLPVRVAHCYKCFPYFYRVIHQSNEKKILDSCLIF